MYDSKSETALGVTESIITKELRHLGEAIGVIVAQVENLGKRLENVLDLESDKKEPGVPNTPPEIRVSRVPSEIRSYRQTLESVSRKIDNILSRLEV